MNYFWLDFRLNKQNGHKFDGSLELVSDSNMLMLCFDSQYIEVYAQRWTNGTNLSGSMTQSCCKVSIDQGRSDQDHFTYKAGTEISITTQCGLHSRAEVKGLTVLPPIAACPFLMLH